jgi:hypothetical protein
MRVLLAVCLITLTLLGQDRFQAVKQALDLSDEQMARIQTHRDPTLSDAQRARLVSIQKILGGDAAKPEARLELINQKDWERRFGGTCLFAMSRRYIDYTTGDVPLSRAQAEQFSAIKFDAWQEIRAKRKQRDVVMSILDATQKAKLAEFESELQIAAEAMELGLIERGGEILCH